MVVALLLGVLGAQPAAAACGGVKQAKPTRDRVPGPYRAPLAIGDSVMLGAVPQMAGAGFEVNVRGCRQMSEGVDLIAARRRSGTLPRAVLVLLGANWNVYTHEIRRALRLLGPTRVLVLLTPRESGGGSGSDAATIRRAGRRWPERVEVLDWVAHAAGRSHWFGGDGLHLAPSGAAALARFSSRALPLAAPPTRDEWSEGTAVARAAGPCDEAKRAGPTRDRVPGPFRAPLAIGDSVMLGAADQMRAAGFEVDVRVCRFMDEGLEVMRARRRAGTLPRAVLLLLGASGDIRPRHVRRALRIAGPERVLVMLTPDSGGGAASDANVIRRAGRRYRGRLVVLDWIAYSAGHPGWFAGDSLHVTPSGAAALARLSSRALPFARPTRGRWTKRPGPALREFGRASARAR